MNDKLTEEIYTMFFADLSELSNKYQDKGVLDYHILMIHQKYIHSVITNAIVNMKLGREEAEKFIEECLEWDRKDLYKFLNAKFDEERISGEQQ